MDVDMEAEDFLELVWGKRKGWVDLPSKMGKQWVTYYTEWEGECPTSITRRIDNCIRDREDLYFSVGVFRERGRRATDFMGSEWLWADLDEADPLDAKRYGLTPTLAWASSNGRYQALWRLDRRVAAERHSMLCQALSYRLGADRGGWDLTQVLRVPGTRNFKYPDEPAVRILWYNRDLSYTSQEIWGRVGAKARRIAKQYMGVGVSEVPGTRTKMPTRARSLLKVPPDAVVEGERSSRLWELECLLVEAGFSDEEIYTHVVGSAWNKWSRVRTGERQLREDIRRARRKVRSRSLEPAQQEEEEVPKRLATISYASLMAMEEVTRQKWLVEGLWTEGSQGIIGGEPKTLKTTLALAMGMSIASGKDFLGEFPVHVRGPVLMIEEENALWSMQDKVRKIAYSYDLISKEDVSISRSEVGSIGSTIVRIEKFPDDIPFHLACMTGFTMEKGGDGVQMLEERIDELRPAMVILDPLYFMIGEANIDRINEIVGMLKWLTSLRHNYGTAIAIVHHMGKKGKDGRQGGQRVLGSTAFHGWIESALWCADDGAEAGWKKVNIGREFRDQEPQGPLQVRLKMGHLGQLDGFESVVTGFNKGGAIVNMVLDSGGRKLLDELVEALGVNRKTVASRARGTGVLDLEGGHGRGDRRYVVYTGNGDVPSP